MSIAVGAEDLSRIPGSEAAPAPESAALGKERSSTGSGATTLKHPIPVRCPS